MPRHPRLCLPGVPLHIIQRGNNRHACFTRDADIAAYANWLAEGSEKYDVKIHAWVFMTNHVHLLVTPSTFDSVPRLMQYLGRLYVRYFNYTYARTGTLFEGRYRSSIIHDYEYLLTCQQYIELNPVRAGMARDPAQYRWSSYGAHAFGTRVKLWTPHQLYLDLGVSADERQACYRQLIAQSMDGEVISRIRHCVNKGLILGSDRFKEEMQKLTGEYRSDG